MCTLVLLRRPDHAWPLFVAANRDEMVTRPWTAPARHWPDRPEVFAGRDVLAGGTWLGLNDHGVVAAILNRLGSLGPAAGMRSRGELVLEALDHADAAPAAEALAALDPSAYRPFNLIIADNRDAFWLVNRAEAGGNRIRVAAVPAGLHMITARDMDDTESPRIRHHRARFAAAPPPAPEADNGAGDWCAWEDLLASPAPDEAGEPEAAMVIDPDNEHHPGFATVSSALIALPSMNRPQARPIFRFAPGRPDETPFETLKLDPGMAG